MGRTDQTAVRWVPAATPVDRWCGWCPPGDQARPAHGWLTTRDRCEAVGECCVLDAVAYLAGDGDVVAHWPSGAGR